MLTQEQISQLKPGDKLKLVNLTTEDNKNGFYGGDIVTYECHMGDNLIAFKEDIYYWNAKHFALVEPDNV